MISILTAIIPVCCGADPTVHSEPGITGAVSRSSAILSSTPIWSVESNQAGADFGTFLAICDVNNDGYQDVIVAAVEWTNGQYYEGAVFAYYGSASGLPTTPSWSFESNAPEAYLAHVACAGDVNGDGYQDIVAGASGYSGGQENEGKIYAFYGSSTGLPPTPSWTYESDMANTYFGGAVASAGDVNGDGYDDVVAGAFAYTNGQTSEGAAWVFYGSPSGLQSEGYWFMESNVGSALFGWAVGHADVNHDGYGDVLIGAYDLSNGEPNEGRSYLYLGSASGLSTTPAWTWEPDIAQEIFGSQFASGDFNGDGYEDAAILARHCRVISCTGRVYIFNGHDTATGLSLTPDKIIDSPRFSDLFDTLAAADLDGDGYDDLIVGAPDYSVTKSAEGAVYIYPGSASGLSTTPVWQMTGDQAGAYFGTSFAVYPDMNGDSCPELVVGQPGYSNGQSSEGRAALYSIAPPNDACPFAQDIPSIPAAVTGSTFCAQDDYTPICGGSGGRDVVYKFDGLAGAEYIVDLTGNFNTVLAVNFASCTGTPAGCNDDYNGDPAHSHVEFTASQTGTYYIWVDALDSSEAGIYTLTITVAIAPTTTTTTTPTGSTTTTTVPADDDSSDDDDDSGTGDDSADDTQSGDYAAGNAAGSGSGGGCGC